MRHLANAQYWDRPAGGNTGRLFLAFGGPVCADRISNCPLDRVLTYKNLIYLLNLQFCGLPVRPSSRSGLTHTEQVAVSTGQDPPPPTEPSVFCWPVHVAHGTSDGNREAGALGSSSCETDSVAPEEQLAYSGVSGEVHSHRQISTSSPVMVARRPGSSRPTIASAPARPSNLYGCLKRRLGRSLRRSHYPRGLVRPRKSFAHKLSGVEGGAPGSQTIRAVVSKRDCFDCLGQHHSGLLYQQGGRYEIRLTLCSPLEAPVVVQPQTNYLTGLTHSGSSQCDCRQTVSAPPGDSDRVVSASSGVQSDLQQMALASDRLVCHRIQQQTSKVCVSGTRSEGLGYRCSQPLLGGTGSLRVSPGSAPGEGDSQAPGTKLQEVHPDSPRLARDAVVLGSGDTVNQDSITSSDSRQPSDSAVQRDPTQGSPQSDTVRLAPRVTAIREQRFSNQVATRIEAPQRSSTRTVYEEKWSVFVRWCESNQVDFTSPSLTQVADFLMHLFQERNLQPSTRDGYRLAIADKIGNARININKNEDLN